jgi:hypothetical protein
MNHQSTGEGDGTMIQKSIDDFGLAEFLLTGTPTIDEHKLRTHPIHVLQDNSLRTYFNMVSSGELGEMEQQVIEALEHYTESIAFEFSAIPIKTCAARILDILNDKKHWFPVKLIETYADRKDLYTGKIPTPWRLSRSQHYYKSELIKFRKRTPVAINEFLQHAEESETNPYSSSINAPPVQLYLANRVWRVEGTEEYKEYQHQRKQKRSWS